MPPHKTKLASFEKEALCHLSELYAIALRYCQNEHNAEDLVQETLLRAYSAWDHFQRGTNCRAWLFRILTNSFINDYRKGVKERQHRQRGEEPISPDRVRAAQDPEGVRVEQLLGDEVVSALRDLPPEFRRVVVLADLQGLSYRDIARELRCPMGTVMSRLFRARRMLEGMLRDYAQEQGILRPLAAAA